MKFHKKYICKSGFNHRIIGPIYIWNNNIDAGDRTNNDGDNDMLENVDEIFVVL